MWKQRNKKPTIVLEMDDKIQMFCLTAAKLSSVLSVQRLGEERFSLNLKPHFGAAQDRAAGVGTGGFTHPDEEWK